MNVARRILVTDGNQRSALAVVRALGRSGMEVTVGESETPNLSARSKYCAHTFRYPSPTVDEAGFVAEIARTARRRSVDLVMPMTDVTTAILAQHRDLVEAVTRLAAADAATFWLASDKIVLHRLADSLGVPHPTVRYAQDRHSLGPTEGLPFPCVVKPARSRVRTASGWVATSVLYASTPEELGQLLATRAELDHPFMVQHLVIGEGAGVFALCDHGRIKILFAHRRLREKPPWGGVSVLREAVEPDPTAVEHTRKILSHLGWHGVAMVEFKRDRRTGILHLMEVNGRFWGSLQLAIDAGVDFPTHVVNLYLGGDVPDNPPYRIGQRSRWLLGDLDHLLLRLKKGSGRVPDAPPLGAMLVDFCRFFRRDTKLEVESWNDPGPSIHEFRRYARDLLHHRNAARA